MQGIKDVNLKISNMFVCYLKVSASTNKEIDAQIPNYPSLPPQLICQLHNLTMHVSDLMLTSTKLDSLNFCILIIVTLMILDSL